MISGYLQSAIQASLNGHSGLEAWRWVFIIEALMTIVVAIYGYFFFPDTPETTRAWYLSEEERERCRERLRTDGREPVGGVWVGDLWEDGGQLAVLDIFGAVDVSVL